MGAAGADREVGSGDDLAAAVAACADGSTLWLLPGRYPARLVLTKTVSLRARAERGQVILDARGGGRVVTASTEDVQVTLVGLTLTGGDADAGPALWLDAWATVSLIDCDVTANRARVADGGVLVARLGVLSLARCRVYDNHGDEATALLAEDCARVHVEDSLLRHAGTAGRAVVTARDEAELTLSRATVVTEGGGVALRARGAAGSAPRITVCDSVLAGAGHPLDLDRHDAPRVTIARTVLAPEARADGYADEGGVIFGDPRFTGAGDEPFRPAPGSPAIGLAKGGRVDLTGRPRPKTGGTAGALEA